jgi:hypothetical protein
MIKPSPPGFCPACGSINVTVTPGRGQCLEADCGHAGRAADFLLTLSGDETQRRAFTPPPCDDGEFLPGHNFAARA